MHQTDTGTIRKIPYSPWNLRGLSFCFFAEAAEFRNSESKKNYTLVTADRNSRINRLKRVARSDAKN
jgi:hypothetical protein